MATAGFNCAVFLTGTSTAMTGEAFTGSGAGPYTITDATKRILGP